MKKYSKIIDGIMTIKKQNQIIVIKDGRQYLNPNEELLFSDGWVEYIAPIPPEPTEKELLERAKSRKLQELRDYDSSKEVNICYIILGDNQLSYWADRTERSSLKTAVQDCIALGRTTYRLDLREKKVSIDINCELLLQMLSALEVYAVDCYNKTTDHEYAISALETIEEVESYDFKVGYPEKLRFNL